MRSLPSIHVVPLAFFCAASLAAAQEPLMLEEVYALALKQSEVIAIKGELLKETEGRFLQALSGALPRASLEASEKRQDGSGGSAFTLKNIPERKFVFSQPLFSGFKEFAAMAGARAERRQRTHEKTRAEHLLLVDAANAFYLLLETREALNVLEVNRSALLERIDELTSRERLGRSRPSERVSAEVQLRRLQADIELARSDETVARQLLAFLIGREPVEGIRDAEAPLPPVSDQAAYAVKMGARPDVLSAEEAWQVARKEVAVARAGFWPDVSLESNYYTKRTGVAEDVTWDALLKVDVPLFQGGQTVGAVREASAKERQAKLKLAQTRRQASLDIQGIYTQLRAAIERTNALEQAVASAEENYRLQREDYQRSLVNNLDVLQALQSLLETRRDFIAAHYEAKRLYWQLRTAAGEALD